MRCTFIFEDFIDTAPRDHSMGLRFIRSLIFLLICLHKFDADAQSMDYTRKIISDLCSPAMYGRGYVNDGVNKAADYLEKEFRRLKLQKMGKAYTQDYSFPVNTFPNPLYCSVDGREMKAGYDYLVGAGSTRIKGHFTLLHFNTNDSLEKILLYKKIKQGFQPDEVPVLHHYGSRDQSIPDSIARYSLPPKFIIRTEEKKLTHTIETDTTTLNQLIFIDSMMGLNEQVELNIQPEFMPRFPNKNLIGYVKGKRTDSFIVYTAHYDHLGMLGKDAIFPGASDNASGVSMVLSLAAYYAKNKPDYNTIFILFSGEEAGLIGSHYFTDEPLFDLKRIKMLINIDIMGNAEKGIVVVNGEECRAAFDLLQEINREKNLLPSVRIRSKAANSDHHFFAEASVPAFFIYSDGGLGYYHDVFDTPSNIALTNYEQVFELLLTFQKRLRFK